MKNNLIIVSGAPGVGKTTLLERLSEEYIYVKEPAREIISEQKAVNGDGISSRNPKKFVDLLLTRSIENYKKIENCRDIILFDRGITDVIAYADWYEFDLTSYIDASKEYRYCDHVFYISPWERYIKLMTKELCHSLKSKDLI